METQLLEVQRNIVEVQHQFLKYKKENENLRKKKKLLEKQDSKIGKQIFWKNILEKIVFQDQGMRAGHEIHGKWKQFIKIKDWWFWKQKLTLFQKGQYSNKVRAAYQDLISGGGVSGNKIVKVVNIVLTKIAGLQVDRLPKPTYGKDMGIEVWVMARYHVGSEISAKSECQFMMLHSNDATKFGESCTNFGQWWTVTRCWDEESLGSWLPDRTRFVPGNFRGGLWFFRVQRWNYQKHFDQYNKFDVRPLCSPKKS